jgi:hypothetical protein
MPAQIAPNADTFLHSLRRRIDAARLVAASTEQLSIAMAEVDRLHDFVEGYRHGIIVEKRAA